MALQIVVLQTGASCVGFSGSCPWSELMESGPGTLSTKAVSTRYPNPWESTWFVFTIFISLEIWHFFPHSISEHGILLFWGLEHFVSCFIPWVSCSQHPILNCCVGLCNLCMKTHTCSFTWRLHSIFWSLTAKWKGKSKVQRCEYAGNCRYRVSS